jgi:glycerol uptake facilitator-like aquaporin
MHTKLLAEFIGTFWLIPLLGGALAGVLHRVLLQRDASEPDVAGQWEPAAAPAARS